MNSIFNGTNKFSINKSTDDKFNGMYKVELLIDLGKEARKNSNIDKNDNKEIKDKISQLQAKNLQITQYLNMAASNGTNVDNKTLQEYNTNYEKNKKDIEELEAKLNTEPTNDDIDSSITKILESNKTITFYVDQEDLPQYSFDSDVVEGYKSVLFNEIENLVKNNPLGKIVKNLPTTYFTPLADENTKKIYEKGDFKDIHFKFRLYDNEYTNSNETTDPLSAFAALSSCIFPLGNTGKGGNVRDYIKSMKDIITNGANFLSDATLLAINDFFNYNETMKKDGKDFSIADIMNEANKDRLMGCATVYINRIGTQKYNDTKDKMRCFLTKIDVTFSKDLIKRSGTDYRPIYIDFDLNLVPVIIPSMETVIKFLYTKEDTQYIENNGNMFGEPLK